MAEMTQITMIEKILKTLPKGSMISQDLFNSLIVWVDSYIDYNEKISKEVKDNDNHNP